MKILDEFKAFAMRGNVIDLAVGVVIGASFGKIVSSLVADIITPAVGVVVGGVNFTKLGYTMTDLSGEAVTIAYGNFLQTLFDFIIIAFAIFMFVKIINKAQEKVIKKQKAEEKKEIAKKADDVLVLEEIRDLLKGVNPPQRPTTSSTAPTYQRPTPTTTATPPQRPTPTTTVKPPQRPTPTTTVKPPQRPTTSRTTPSTRTKAKTVKKS